MLVYIVAFVVISLAVAGMALGVLLSDRRLKGSCGGLNRIDGLEKPDCGCENPCERRLAREKEAGIDRIRSSSGN
jgi:hypothetical protein